MRVLSLARMQKYDMRKPESYCVDCGAIVSPGSKRCKTCGSIYSWRNRERKDFERGVKAEIKANMKTYGPHPQCRYCRRDCKSWNALNSKILYCPRILLAPELAIQYNKTVTPLNETL
jgi:hypothetical protein